MLCVGFLLGVVAGMKAMELKYDPDDFTHFNPDARPSIQPLPDELLDLEIDFEQEDE